MYPFHWRTFSAGCKIHLPWLPPFCFFRLCLAASVTLFCCWFHMVRGSQCDIMLSSFTFLVHLSCAGPILFGSKIATFDSGESWHWCSFPRPWCSFTSWICCPWALRCYCVLRRILPISLWMRSALTYVQSNKNCWRSWARSWTRVSTFHA